MNYIYYDKGKAKDVFKRFNAMVTGESGGWTGVPDYNQNPASNKVSTIIMMATKETTPIPEYYQN
uniref:Uncharacterized protein n=1 Tax=viral metagenome TaxID=1070528 RepID=A0A6M3J4Q4_9ZZZZ